LSTLKKFPVIALTQSHGYLFFNRPYAEKGVGLMDFCLKCGSRLIPKKVKSGEQIMLVLACSKCGHKTRELSDYAKLNGKTIEHSPKQFVSVIDKENQLSILPTIQISCPKCGNNAAYAWQVQTRGADESSTQFLRCTNCEYTFREST
jgi:DNA-directed RNA polymerase subunit M